MISSIFVGLCRWLTYTNAVQWDSEHYSTAFCLNGRLMRGILCIPSHRNDRYILLSTLTHRNLCRGFRRIIPPTINLLELTIETHIRLELLLVQLLHPSIIFNVFFYIQGINWIKLPSVELKYIINPREVLRSSVAYWWLITADTIYTCGCLITVATLQFMPFQVCVRSNLFILLITLLWNVCVSTK